MRDSNFYKGKFLFQLQNDQTLPQIHEKRKQFPKEIFRNNEKYSPLLQFSKAILQEYDRQPEKGGSFNQPFLKASGSQLSYPSRDSGPACEEKLLLFWRVGDQLYCVSKQYG